MSERAIRSLQGLIDIATPFDMAMGQSGRVARIFVSRPIAPPPPDGYPVLYMTDANLLFATMAQQVMLRAVSGDIADSIVVGIGYPVPSAVAALTERMIDFAPSAVVEQKEGAATIGMRGLGDFVIDHLIPAIDARYPIDPSRRSLFGYSLGGLFALHLVARAGERFASAAAASPSIWCDEPSLLRAWDEGGCGFATRLLMTVGSLEQSPEHVATPPGMSREQAIGMMEAARMIDRARSFAARVRRHAASDGQVVLIELAGETHASTAASAISSALTFMLSSRS